MINNHKPFLTTLFTMGLASLLGACSNIAPADDELSQNDAASTLTAAADAQVQVRFRSAGVGSANPNAAEAAGGFEQLRIIPPEGAGDGSHTRIVLLRGGDAHAFTAWLDNNKLGVDLRHGTITVLDQDLETIVRQYQVKSARPLSITFSGASPAAALEKLELAVEKVERVM